jgi:phage portal protein BeeE
VSLEPRSESGILRRSIAKGFICETATLKSKLVSRAIVADDLNPELSEGLLHRKQISYSSAATAILAHPRILRFDQIAKIVGLSDYLIGIVCEKWMDFHSTRIAKAFDLQDV